MARVEYTYVKSSHIQGIAYDAATSTLYVQFNSGAEYKYADVPEADYEAFVAAASPGQYFHDSIRDSYTATRI